MGKIYIRAGMSPLEPIGIGEAIQKDTFGLNTGNLIYQYSVFRTLMRADTRFDARFIQAVCDAPGGVERLNEECDLAIIPLANAFRPGFKLKPLTDMIRRLKIPCVVVGCGLQAQRPEEIREGFPFDADVRDFVNAALEKSALLGLRGEYTAAYFQHLGYAPERHFTVIGCPSLFLNGPRMPRPATPAIDGSTRFNLNTREIQNPALNELIARTEAEYPDYHLTLQKRRELATLAYGLHSNVTSPQRDSTGFYPFDRKHRDVRNGRAIGFTEARSWFDYMKGVDYSFGSRIHGNIAAVVNGVPAFVFTSDTRTEELCRYANIPHMPIDGLRGGEDIREIFEKADFEAVCRDHRRRFDHFVDFLNRNGVPHIYRETPDPETVPFDEAMKRVPAGGVVRRGCLSAPEVALRLMKHYRVALRWKLFRK